MGAYTLGIAAYNEEKGITRLMNFLVTQSIPEILIYNDGSKDKTEKLLEPFCKLKNVRLISNSENRGYGWALNQIILNAKYNLVVMIDADTLPEEGAIQKLVYPFSDNLVGATSGTHITEGLRSDSIVSWVNKRIYKAKRLIDTIQFSSGNFIHLNGLLFAVRRDILPNPLDLMTNQDAYLGWLIKKLGYKRIFLPDAKSVFHPPKTLRDYFNSRKRVIRGHMALVHKYGVKEYFWHECGFKQYLLCVVLALPFSVRGFLSLMFGAVIDIWFRLYWFHFLRKNPKKFDEYVWEQVGSTKW